MEMIETKQGCDLCGEMFLEDQLIDVVQRHDCGQVEYRDVCELCCMEYCKKDEHGDYQILVKEDEHGLYFPNIGTES